MRTNDPELAGEVHKLQPAAIDPDDDLVDRPLVASLPDLVAEFERPASDDLGDP